MNGCATESICGGALLLVLAELVLLTQGFDHECRLFGNKGLLGSDGGRSLTTLGCFLSSLVELLADVVLGQGIIVGETLELVIRALLVAELGECLSFARLPALLSEELSAAKGQCVGVEFHHRSEVLQGVLLLNGAANALDGRADLGLDLIRVDKAGDVGVVHDVLRKGVANLLGGLAAD